MSLYQDLLGPKYRLLPPLVRHMHNVNGEVRAAGMGSVDRGPNPVSRLIAALLGILQPLLIVIMGAIVLTIVLAILLPIFEINNLIR